MSAETSWRRWFDGLNRRQQVRRRLEARLGRFEDWLCQQEGWLSERDWLYVTDSLRFQRALCLVLDHIWDGPRVAPLCYLCGAPDRV